MNEKRKKCAFIEPQFGNAFSSCIVVIREGALFLGGYFRAVTFGDSFTITKLVSGAMPSSLRYREHCRPHTSRERTESHKSDRPKVQSSFMLSSLFEIKQFLKDLTHSGTVPGHYHVHRALLTGLAFKQSHHLWTRCVPITLRMSVIQNMF